ncbi:hypothetical protein CVT24_008689 [Panaeolus cyanescens]|uniref:Uncharacterized protein n=1 Tax=Panaeolus cyanescens TaxID=181874 RepID=A0A409VKP4_9AGAR|nr:hypothetical protein CVT24_008689 [Panaeolus cyanescens]
MSTSATDAQSTVAESTEQLKRAPLCYIAGPKHCPGVRNTIGPNGKPIRRLAYAIPVMSADIVRFIDKYWPDPKELEGIVRPQKLSLLAEHFPGRPDETKSIAIIYLDWKAGQSCESFGVVIGKNDSEESIKKAEASQDIVRKIQDYFGTNAEPGWYKYHKF